MQVWNADAGWETVFAYLGVLSKRMLAHAKINWHLSAEQKKLLLAEAKALVEVRAKLKKEGRALEDFQDDVLDPTRAEAFVWDFLCDESNGDAWRTLGMSRGQSALLAAGKRREDIFDTTRLGDVTALGRLATVAVTRKVGEELVKLDQLDDAKDLSKACLQAAGGLETVGRKLDRPGGELMTAEARLLGAAGDIANAQRVAMPKLYGRLLQSFPKPFVEALFPRVARGSVVPDGDGQETPTNDKPA